jgi:hypothetical protein
VKVRAVQVIVKAVTRRVRVAVAVMIVIASCGACQDSSSSDDCDITASCVILVISHLMTRHQQSTCDTPTHKLTRNDGHYVYQIYKNLFVAVSYKMANKANIVCSFRH